MILNWIIDVGPGDTGQTMRIAADEYAAAIEALEELKTDPTSGISIAELKAKVGRAACDRKE